MHKPSLGVLVVRVQVDDLHEGHYDIFKEVIDSHDRTLAVIGLSACKCTQKNPLDYDTRRRMILQHFPDIMVAYIQDMQSDTVWSQKLDNIIASKLRDDDDVCLYGSRDSFITHYKGVYQTRTLQQRVFVSGTEIRKQLSMQSRNSRDFRAGAIWYALNQYPAVYPTIDIAVLDRAAGRVLLGKRASEPHYRFIGGFVDPGETYEQAAVRELQEEAHLTAEHVLAQRSFVIDDWRYRNEVGNIVTQLFITVDWHGVPIPDDDIDELRWFPVDEKVLYLNVMPEHRDIAAYVSMHASTYMS